MRHRLAVAWTIARRDYGATVFSRLFLLFLVTPLFPFLFGGMIAVMGIDDNGAGAPPVIGVTADAPALVAARARLADRLGDGALPRLEAVPPGDPAAVIRAGGVAGVLRGGLDRPALLIADEPGFDRPDRVGLIVDTARAARGLGDRLPPPVAIATRRIEGVAAAPRGGDRAGLGRGAQLLVFTLTLLLAGMLLSNLIEEKSNKVIEVLVAAVPVEAIFLGKLAGMLAISLTGIAVWGVAAVAGLAVAAPSWLAQMPAPAIGWGAFVPLVLAYFIANYLLLGALFLALGAHAASPREVQILSMPVTMIQLLVFGFASTGAAHPGGAMAWAAQIFPWSSPLAMTARGALDARIWPHLAALAWQALWLALAVRLAAASFRRAVLQSGGERRGRVYRLFTRSA